MPLAEKTWFKTGGVARFFCAPTTKKVCSNAIAYAQTHQLPITILGGGANVLIFPDLASGNIAYKLLGALGEAELIGPILMGMKKPVHLLQVGSSTAKDVVNMTAYAVVDAQREK